MNTRRIEWAKRGTERVRRLEDAEDSISVIVEVTTPDSVEVPSFNNLEDATAFARKHAGRYPSEFSGVQDVGAFTIEHLDAGWIPLARIRLQDTLTGDLY